MQSTKEDLVKSTFSQSLRNETTKHTASKMQMSSAIQPSKDDLFERADDMDDIFGGNERFGAIVDDYKRVVNRRPKE